MMLIVIIAALWAMYELFRKFSLVEAFPESVRERLVQIVKG